MDGLAIIGESDILKQSDLAGIVAIKDELLKSMDTVQMFRTRTEMIVSVLNDMKRPTPDAKYWQAVREQNSMFHELINLSFAYRKNVIEIKKLKEAQELAADPLDKELIQIEIEQREFGAIGMERTARERIREIMLWSQLKNDLLPQLEYGVEDVNLHQLKAMKISFERQARMVTPHTPPAEAQNIIGLAEMVQ